MTKRSKLQTIDYEIRVVTITTINFEAVSILIETQLNNRRHTRKRRRLERHLLKDILLTHTAIGQPNNW